MIDVLKKNKISVVAALAFMFGVALFFSGPVSAAPLSVVVSPPSTEVSLEPGKSYTGSINITNPADATEELAYKAYVAPYGVKNLTYDADLSTQTTMTKITDWITLENPTGTIAVNSKAVLNYTINTPADAPAGGQYAAIMIQASSGENDATIGEVFEIASIIFAKIGGNNTVDGKILSVETPSFMFEAPITTTATFSNTGNVHATAKITAELRSAMTGEVIFPDIDEEVSNSLTEIIMPGTERALVFTIEKVPMLGVYNLKETISYLDDTFTDEKVIFICPIWFLVMVIVAIALIIIAVIATIKRKVKK